MSHPIPHNDDSDDIMLRPRPKDRTFELASPPSTAPSSPPPEKQSFSNLQTPGGMADGSTTPARTRSILNLTSSTLFGIYQPTGYAMDREEPSTPWGTGAETPVEGRDGSFDLARSSLASLNNQKGPDGNFTRRRSTMTPVHHAPRRGFRGLVLPAAVRMLAMASVGVMYGLLISHLHDRQGIAPVKLEGVNRQSWTYLSLWACLGVTLSEALPRLDKLWTPHEDEDLEEKERPQRRGHGSGDWFDVVRAIGIFVGIAFAIRRLPWQSTMQLALTLAIANPALWYLIDRTPAGFTLSTLVSVSGTAIILSVNPALVPSPSAAQVLQSQTNKQANGANAVLGQGLVLGLFSQESVSVATWIASVLFVSSVCFGNIGRRLVPRDR
ncbi:hypothetical protein BAUCODRAFT_39485 [Baudoinia panamericana UAMH 10762]|uniref:Insulin-induced protein n=1 Tax=Baudoinia panamericana (strain UAMH 10762) TaxID=717646 RepID=M2LBR2_BAUPA|nr:uncharacterized protein BAUCODRAFT_39485 [Baudoinia panamericana UAMH 10762]EMC91317.1 hypothetical protein BAUCODRAFT_39485 [Baudoinia panamericana UAMH 10762]